MSYHCIVHKSIECNGCLECEDRKEELLTAEEIEEFEQFETLLEEENEDD